MVRENIIIHLVVQVVTQQQVEELRHTRRVVVQARGAVGREQRRAHRVEHARVLVRPRGVEEDLVGQQVERAPVPRAKPLEEDLAGVMVGGGALKARWL